MPDPKRGSNPLRLLHASSLDDVFVQLGYVVQHCSEYGGMRIILLHTRVTLLSRDPCYKLGRIIDTPVSTIHQALGQSFHDAPKSGAREQSLLSEPWSLIIVSLYSSSALDLSSAVILSCQAMQVE
jgi:hypothetical protein